MHTMLIRVRVHKICYFLSFPFPSFPFQRDRSTSARRSIYEGINGLILLGFLAFYALVSTGMNGHLVLLAVGAEKQPDLVDGKQVGSSARRGFDERSSSHRRGESAVIYA